MSSLVAPIVLLAAAVPAFAADDRPIPEADRTVSAALALVGAALGFKTSCGLSTGDQEADLLKRYASSADYKRRDPRVLSGVFVMMGAETQAVKARPSACTEPQHRHRMLDSLGTAREIIEYAIKNPGVALP
jgi:hypothetical protein